MQQLAYAQPPAEPSPGALRLDCAARAGELARIVLVNALLTILTLGIYRFWAKTRVRRYLWSRTSLLGDAFEYTGTGGELFRGFLVVLFLVLLPLFAYSWAIGLLIPPERVWLQLAALAPFYAAILFLLGVATHRARRYRFSRTSWRGVHGAQQGSAARYGLKYFGSMLLNAVTLGWTYPWANTRLTAALTNDVWFGDRRFAFAGSAKPLYKRFAAVWLLGLLLYAVAIGGLVALFTLEGLLPDPETTELLVQLLPLAMILVLVVVGVLTMAWYRAREAAYFADCTRYEGLQARYDVTAGALIWLTLSNLLLLVVTLGLGGAFVEMRNLRFVCERLSFHGAIDLAAIAQSPVARPARGEGLASAFDVDAM
jgi:uncharacterized membrane protein YjgN (DUF898 family)